VMLLFLSLGNAGFFFFQVASRLLPPVGLIPLLCAIKSSPNGPILPIVTPFPGTLNSFFLEKRRLFLVLFC